MRRPRPPLSDLNLVQAPIPEALAAAQRGPYALGLGFDCPTVEQAIRALDDVLGPDLEAPPARHCPSSGT